jgi:hypothetical protein
MALAKPHLSTGTAGTTIQMTAAQAAAGSVTCSELFRPAQCRGCFLNVRCLPVPQAQDLHLSALGVLTQLTRLHFARGTSGEAKLGTPSTCESSAATFCCRLLVAGKVRKCFGGRACLELQASVTTPVHLSSLQQHGSGPLYVLWK